MGRIKAAWRVLTRKEGEFPAEVERDDGWTDWIHPQPGYLLECCDCGLIHRMRFSIENAKAMGVDLSPAMLNDGETPTRAIFFGAQRLELTAPKPVDEVK